MDFRGQRDQKVDEIFKNREVTSLKHKRQYLKRFLDMVEMKIKRYEEWITVNNHVAINYV